MQRRDPSRRYFAVMIATVSKTMRADMNVKTTALGIAGLLIDP